MYRVADVPVDPVSIFDVLWRFRRWANYLEADTIIEGGEFQPYAIEFDDCFNNIMEARQLSRSRASSAATLAPGRYTLSTKSSWRSRTAISTPPQSSDGGTLSVA
jgi:hypothetical protein